MRALFDHYLRLVTGYPKLVLGLIALLALALALGLPRFKLDASSESLTLEHDKDLNYFRQVAQQFQSGDFLVVTYKPEVDLFSDQGLETLAELKQDLSNIEGVVGINSILDVPLLYSPKQSISDIVTSPRTLQSEGVDREMARKEFQNSPIYKNLILGPDGQTTALQLSLAVDNKYIDLVQKRDNLRYKRDNEGLSEEETQELERVSKEFLAYRTAAEARNHERVGEVRAVVDKYKDKAQIFVGGITMITADMIRFIKKDLVVFGSAVIVFMILILAFIFRSARFVIIPMACCMIAVLMMLGYVSWLDWRLTVISSNFVALLLIISLAIIIHLVVRYREYAAEHPDWTQKQIVEATVRFMARPCLYTSLTTIVAFASLVVSDIRPVIDFGWMMTIGLVVALVLAFLLMPASLMLLSREPAKKALAAGFGVASKGVDSENNGESRVKKPLTAYFSQLVEKNGLAVIVGSIIVAVLSVIGITRLQVENRFIDYFHESTEIYQGLSVIDKNLGGTTSLDIILSAPEAAAGEETSQESSFDDEEDPFGDPFGSDTDADEDKDKNYWLTVAGLKRIEEVHDYLDSLPEVGKVQSLAILYKVGKDINGGLNDFELAIMRKTLSKEVKNVLINPYVPASKEQTRITLRIEDTYPGLQRKQLVDRIRNHIIEQQGYAEENVRLTGLLVLYNNMLQSLFKSQIVTLGAVFLGIMLMFLILFRSFSVALVAILPNCLAALSVLGTMGLIGLPLDMMTITVAAITVGIGVDDTIHYIHRFKEEFKVDGDYIATMHRAHSSIGRAMYYTSVIIVFGFSIMVLSEFIPTIYFGLLTGFAMFAALMGALLLLPKLILIVKPFSK